MNKEIQNALFFGEYPTRTVTLFPKSLKRPVIIPLVDVYIRPYDQLTQPSLSKEAVRLLCELAIKPTLDPTTSTVALVDQVRIELVKASCLWLDNFLKELPQIVKDTRGVWYTLRSIEGKCIPGAFELKHKMVQYRWIEAQLLEDRKERAKEISELVKIGVNAIHPGTVSADSDKGQARENVLFDEQVRQMEVGTFGEPNPQDYVFQSK